MTRRALALAALAAAADALARFRYLAADLCLGAPFPFPCANGSYNSCPLALTACGAADAVWAETAPSLLCNNYWGPGGDVCANVDCLSTAPGALVKLLAGGGREYAAVAFSGGQLQYTARDGMIRCLRGGQGPVTPPCDGDFYTNSSIAIDYCIENATKGWSREAVEG